MDWTLINWKLLVTQGVIGVVFGVVAMVWPIASVVTLVVLWGIFALVDGVGSIVAAFRAQGGGAKTWLVVIGAISILAGLYAVIHPGTALVALTWAVGLWLIIRAAYDLYAAFAFTDDGVPRWLRVVGAVLLGIAGFIIVTHPGTAALAFTVWIGLLALLWGVLLVVAGLVLRSAVRKTVATGASTTGV
ncbi:MAG TPA: DUF308 domain-containing protein [Humibacillus xanthopallidus]|nr:DUF308 domain-containing protein [Humibacillus xanthopallidus]